MGDDYRAQFPGSVGYRIFRNFDVYSNLAEAAGLPYTQRPELYVMENSNMENKTKRNYKVMAFLVGVVAVYFIWKSHKRNRRRGG